MNSIGERIKYLRKEVLNKTQKEFGSQIGLKPNSVSDIESGKNNPTEQTIKAICREYNVNYFWLTKGDGEIFFTGQDAIIDAVAEQYNLSNIGKSIVAEFLKLPPATRNSVEQYILNIAAAINNKEQP